MEKQMNREKKIIQTSVIGIITNVFLAAVKFVLGLRAGSVSIMSDAMNNFSDSFSSVLAIVSTFLSGKKPDKQHPFGHGRIEYMINLIIANIILVTGLEILINSFKSIFAEQEAEYTATTLIIITITIFTKIVLGVYTQATGRKIHADSLIAIGADAKGDALLSCVIILSAISSMYFGFSIDAYAGMLIAVFIIKSGIEIVQDALNMLIGEKPDPEYTHKILSEVEQCEGVLSAHDLIIHNYGPKINMGTVNVELECHTKVGDIYPVLHRLQIDILKKYKIYLVFGFYSVAPTSEATEKLQSLMEQYVEGNSDCTGYHGLFVDTDTREVYVDIVLNYMAEIAKAKAELAQKIQAAFDGYQAIVTVDREFV